MTRTRRWSFGALSVAGIVLIAVAGVAQAAVAVKISGAPAASIAAGSFYSFRPTVMAASGSKLTYTVVNKPAWASFSVNSGWLFGVPSSGRVGSYSNIIIKVSDSKTSASLPAFKIAVTKTGATTSGTGSALLSWTRPTKNTDGTSLINLSGYRIHYGNVRITGTTGGRPGEGTVMVAHRGTSVVCPSVSVAR